MVARLEGYRDITDRSTRITISSFASQRESESSVDANVQ
jgi:hypothetical protein